MADFDAKHLRAALSAAGSRILEEEGSREEILRRAMQSCDVPVSDEHIVSALTAALVGFAIQIRRAETKQLPIRGIEVS